MFDAREFRRSLAAFATGVAIVSSSSLAAFARARYFAINVLTADQRELSQRFSSTVADKFDGVMGSNRPAMRSASNRAL